MKLFYFIIVTIILSLSSCASDGPIETPRLSLNPDLLIDSSNIGEDKTIKLLVLNQLDINTTSTFAYETNLRELISELFTDGFEQQGYDIETGADAEVPAHTTYLTIILTKADNQIKKKTLKSEILAHIQLTVKAKQDGNELNQNFESRRSEEVALSADKKEVEQVVNKALAQVVKRVITNKELMTFMNKK